MNVLFNGLFDSRVPDALFAEIPAAGSTRKFTYQDVIDATGRYANALTEEGVRPGDRVAVQVDKSIEAIILYLATVRVGAIFLPLNSAYTVAEVEYFLENASPTLFVCAPEKKDAYKSLLEKLGIKLTTLGVWDGPGTDGGELHASAEKSEVEFATVPRTADDLAAILYTSGTTGRSKGAMLSHDNLLSNALVLKDYWQFSSNDVLLHALPIFHTHGLFVATNTTLVSGSSLVFLPGFNVDSIIEHLPSVTSMMGVPTFYTRLLDDSRLERELVKDVRLFVSGSAPLLAETHVEFESRTGHRILERYGMTETNMNTSNPYNGERKAGTVGFPLPGVEIRIADAENGNLLSDGEVGIVEVKGPNVFSGYWKMPEKTKEEFREDGFFITGDMGSIDEDGYLKIVGRAKDLIISGGYNIYPKELELLLDEQYGVLESAVIGVPHPDFGEAVVGVLVAKQDHHLDESEILSDLGDKIARFKQPKRLIVIDELPRNTMGKVQKNVLREEYKSLLTG